MASYPQEQELLWQPSGQSIPTLVKPAPKAKHVQATQKPPRPLTGKQKVFTHELIKNPTQPAYQAAKKAGYKGNSNTLMNIASDNLRKPKIAEILQRHAEQAEDVLLEVMNYSLQLGKTGTAAGASYASNARQSATDVLNRVHGTPTQHTVTTSKAVVISVDLTGVVDPNSLPSLDS